MDVGDLSGTAGLVGSGSISIATGVGIIANTTSATPGWWTPTSTIAPAAANTDVVSLFLSLFISLILAPPSVRPLRRAEACPLSVLSEVKLAARYVGVDIACREESRSLVRTGTGFIAPDVSTLSTFAPSSTCLIE